MKQFGGKKTRQILTKSTNAVSCNQKSFFKETNKAAADLPATATRQMIKCEQETSVFSQFFFFFE